MPSRPDALSRENRRNLASYEEAPRRGSREGTSITNLECLDAHIDSSFERHLNRVRTFVRRPSISGESVGMREMAELVRHSIRGLGGDARLVTWSWIPAHTEPVA